MRILRYLLPTLILLTLMCLLLFPGAIFKGKSLIPGDLLYFYEPWHSEYPGVFDAPSNMILLDDILEFYPWRETLINGMKCGEIPLWDPTAFCGYPFMALFQTAVLYPLDRIFDLIPSHAYPLARNILHMFLAGVGMALFLRDRRHSAAAAAMGALAFGAGGFMVLWLGHPHAKVAAWLPWLYLGVHRMISGKRYGRRILGIAAAGSLLAGHVETALHTGTACALYGLIILFYQRPARGQFKRIIVSSCALLVWAIMLGAGIILPFAEYLIRSVAYATRADGVLVQAYLDKVLMLAQFMPDLFGRSIDRSYWYNGFNYAEVSGGFVGIVLISFALIAMVGLGNRTLRHVHTILVVVFASVVYKVFPIYQFFTQLPGYRMSYNFRMVLPMAFSLIVLGTAFWDEYTRKPSQYIRRFTPIFFVIVLVLGITPVLIRHLPGAEHAPLAISLIWAGSVLMAVMVLSFLCVKFPGRMGVWHTAMILLVVAELWHFGFGFNPSIDRHRLFPEPESIKITASQTGPVPGRILPVGRIYPPHVASMMGIQDVRGNDALTPRIVEDYVALADPGVLAPYKLPALRMMWIDQWSSPLWNALNIEYLFFSDLYLAEAPRNLIPVKTMGRVHVFKNPEVMDRAFMVSHWRTERNESQRLKNLGSTEFDPSQTAYIEEEIFDESSLSKTPPGNAQITEYARHRVVIEAECSENNILVLSDTFYPGWRVRVNGEPGKIIKVNQMMRGVFLKPGTHVVRFDYFPISFLLGLFLTFTGVLVGLGFGVCYWGSGHHERGK